MYRIILDTNVIYSAVRSTSGASFRLLNLIPDNRFEINLSPPLVFEYEEILKREDKQILLSHEQIDDVLNYLCKNGNQRLIHFLWRPMLTDTDDDLLLELAIESNSDFIITFNTKDFLSTEEFGIRAIRPIEFLRIIGENK